jgi:hypothetical protein
VRKRGGRAVSQSAEALTRGGRGGRAGGPVCAAQWYDPSHLHGANETQAPQLVRDLPEQRIDIFVRVPGR